MPPTPGIIHLDIEPSQVGRNVPVEVPLVGDAKVVMRALIPLVKRVERPQWMSYIEQLKADHPSPGHPQDQFPAGPARNVGNE